MKKFTLMMVVMLACLFRANAQEPQFVSKEQQNRNVLIEELTGRLCGYCPGGQATVNQLVAKNPERIFSVNIHAKSSLSPTNYPNLNTTKGATLFNAFIADGIPAVVINRMEDEQGTLIKTYPNYCSSYVDAQMKEVAEVNMGGRVVVNPVTRIATITVEAYYTGNSEETTNYLTIMMLQDSILGSQSGATSNPAQIINGEYCHMHILRDVITDTWGDAIAPTTVGSLITKTYTYEIPEVIGDPNGVEVDLDNIQFLAFITEKENGAATEPILNVCELDKIEGTDEPIHPFIKTFVQEDLITCDKTKKFTANVVNGGTEVLTSIKFEISVNNGETTTQEWTGRIPVYGNVNVDLFAEVPFGGELVTVKIVEANGEEFSFEKSVMAQSEEWIQVELGDTQATEQFKLELAQDRFGNQTKWQVVGHNDKVIASGGPYKLLPQSGIEVHEEYFTIPVGECVRFIIEDNVGNGINNNFGQGYYKIYDSKGNILVESDGKFGYGEYHIIYVNGEGGDDNDDPEDPSEGGDDNEDLENPSEGDSTITNCKMRLSCVYSEDGFESWDYIYSSPYDTDLVCINEIDFTTNNEIIDSIFYDERGNIIKIATWQKVEGEWIYIGYIEYEYNDKNQKTSRTNYNNFGNGFELGGIYRYYYDEEGKMTEWALEFFGIDTYQKYIIEYNEDGLKDTETMQQYSFESYYLENQFLTDYKYDANNNVKRINEFVWDGETWELQHFKLYEYDEFGNCLVAEQTTASGTVQERKVYTYDTSVSAENVFYYPNPENDYPQLPESKKHLLKSFEYWAQNDDMQLSYVTTYVMDYEVVEEVAIGDNKIIDYENYSLKFTVTSISPAECEVSGYSGEPVDVTIPSKVIILGKEYTVTSIGNYAFNECSSLTSIEIPNSVTSIGDGVFQSCSNLTSIEIPNSVTSIGSHAFQRSGLISLTIPKNITYIGSVCFALIPNLETILVESDNAVYDSRNNCNAIIETATNKLITACKNTTIPQSITSIGVGAFGGTEFVNIEIPNSITNIEGLAFAFCPNLENVTFEENSQLDSICPEVKTDIFNGLFFQCEKIKSFEIPQGVKYIGRFAFSNCKSLTSLYCHAVDVPETSESAFNNCTSDMIIYVPTNSVDAYKAASPWNEYTILAMEDEPDDPENPGGDEPDDPENPGGDEPEQPAKTYSVIAVANPENAGTVEGAGVYAENMNVTLVATAKSGYKFVNWTENGVIVSTEAEYSFVITNNRNLTANFVSTNCKLTVVINPEEAGKVEGAGTYKKDTEVKLIATANPGYKFVNWTENDAIVSTNPEYSFVITDNTDLVANFVSTENISELTSSFSIYPNPVNDKLYIETQTLTQTLTVEIYDVYGRQQSTVNGQQTTCIDVTNLNSGVYFVKVITTEGDVVKRFVKK